MSEGSGSPRNWARAALGDVTFETVPQTGPTGGEFTYIDISSLDNRLKRVVAPKPLPTRLAPSRARQNLAVGDLVVSMTRPNLNAVALVPPELDGAVGSTGFHVLRVMEMDPRWVYYAVQTDKFVVAMAALVQGALYPAVRPNDVRSFDIPVPPVAEQRRIVAEIEKQFTRLEAAEAVLRRAQANLKRYRAAVLKAACEGRLVPTEVEPARVEGHEDWALDREAGRQEARGLPPLPVGWCWRSLGSLLLSLRNGISVKPEGQLGIPILRISAVRPMRVDLRDIRHLSLSHAGKLGQYELTEGDLLFTRYNGNPELVGVCGCVRDNPSGTVYPDKLIRGRVQPDAALPKFIEVAVNTGESRSFLASRVRTTAGQAGISGADLKATPVPLPPLAGQHRIVAEVERRLSVVEQLEASVQANLQRAARLRQAILKRAFEGRLVPQDPDDEPASVLLERIRRQRAQQQTTRPVRRRPRKDVS